MKFIPFNKNFIGNNELKNINLSVKNGYAGNVGPNTHKAEREIKKIYGNSEIILTHSCTAALEMVSLLINVKKSDEIIMPSFTFISTANAFAIHGAKIVFADINNDDLNININNLNKLITRKTKAIVAVHYAGNSCDMKKLSAIAKKKKIYLIEDAAQAFMSRDKYGKLLGTYGDFATFSFHETKNIISGQGGALIINQKKFNRRARYIRDKGSNKSDFDKNIVKKYTWVDYGSSYTIGEISASILNAQLKKKDTITIKKKYIWDEYYKNLQKYNNKLYTLPKKINLKSNAHIFYILLKNETLRQELINRTRKKFQLISHYEALHMSKAGKKFGITKTSMKNTISISKRLLRLPNFVEIKKKEIKFISDTIIKELKLLKKKDI
jgi:dTDP-4-amino-4,6-dideoxygalactose transaminase